ncbi:hypothetical protein PG985_003236 [Apiospora marii]|uniref:uncharacterized protein n=1 Tax=Apiospora marii TaxID=335849 RepID=UPI003131E4A9
MFLEESILSVAEVVNKAGAVAFAEEYDLRRIIKELGMDIKRPQGWHLHPYEVTPAPRHSAWRDIQNTIARI